MASSSDISVPRALLSHYSRIGTTRAERTLFDRNNGVGPSDFAHALIFEGGRPELPRSLHINLPFCPVRCLNCDNDSVITHDATKIDRYIDGLEREIGLLVGAAGFKPQLQELHLGGGSPNYLNDRQLVRLMAMLEDHFRIDEDTDLSLDANPRRSSPSQLTLLKGLGFDRISFGIRDLDPRVQLAIGRTTSFDMIRDVFETARDIGFRSIGTDIHYGLPCQTTDGVKRTVNDLLALSPDRIACFAFTRHAAARAHQSALDHCAIPSLADKMVLFNTIVEGLVGEYDWVGLDCFARPDDELARAQAEGRLYKSWTGYSHLPTTEVYGLGTSAITDLEEICVQNHINLGRWTDAVDADEFPIRGGIRLEASHRAQRDAIRTLMCNMELSDYASLFQNAEDKEHTWEICAREGLVSISGNRMRVTDQGRYVLPHLLAN